MGYVDDIANEFTKLHNPLDRMNLFGADIVEMSKDEEEEVFTEEFKSLFYQNSETVKVDKAYSGLLPEVSGNCDNIVNKVLNMKEVDLTKIGKSFYTTDLLTNTPKDENSKRLYASIINQLVCYNILNTAHKELFGACTLKINTEGAPAWFNLENTCKILVYILRERKMNAIALKRSDNCDLFIETFTRDINKRDEIKSSIDYIKLIIKGDVSESKYHTIEVSAKEVINAIGRDLFQFKMEPMQDKLYDAEEHWTKLEALDDEAKHLKFIDELPERLKECHSIACSSLRLCSTILSKLGKYGSSVENLKELTELYGVCCENLEHDYKDDIVALAQYINNNLGFIDEEKRDTLNDFTEKGIVKLIEDIFEILKRYRDAYLYLDMAMTEEELKETEKKIDNVG